MIPTTEPAIQRDDATPSVMQQAKLAGWEAGTYDFGAANMEGKTYFNPGLVQRRDGLWLLVRRSENDSALVFGRNSVWAVKLDESGRAPLRGVRLQWNDSSDQQQYEDARVFHVDHLNQTGVSCCTFEWHDDNSWTGAIQVLGFFDSDWQCRIAHYVPFDTNSTSLQAVPREHYQKNWLFWMKDNKLHLLYKSKPWIVASFDGEWTKREIFTSEGAAWPHGEIRGGTPPVLVGDRYYTFFHSSMPWRGNYRRYFFGAIAFAAEAPFAPIAITSEPLLTGSQNDVWEMRKPLCVFPCGAIIRDGVWFVTYGLNDLRCGWVEIPHRALVERLTPMSPPVEAPSAPPPPVKPPPKEAPPVPSEPESRKEMMRARMAHARAARTNKSKKKIALAA